MRTQTLTYTQVIPAEIDEVWSFFANPLNLERITPPDIHFTITTPVRGEELHEGMKISYMLSPILSLPLRWVTGITRVEKPERFEDEQVEGPYEYWHHRHEFTPVENGVMMTDTIEYRIPYGPFGELLDVLFINRRLDEVFRYRQKKVEEIFGFAEAV
ncbi:SRPBCC family protein [Prosthecochloris sp. N3]|uniref:SRPBCC family protein n=1 Tax=Prosthecochloris ethylica TaxID=2743976 RepID=A0ABR9XSH7_9CHLB|nr:MULTISPECIES: SRPBCC family protein [Prosthecochloris]MEC9487076.1 SRPBCC family protein [Prosthecochloris sp.]MBF0585348.1 SRPBCC family protein [Prosthecochloris ethylica]MBF0636884.1 SRPBCC family protein [Prosthecochloris ethylica]NUK46577.1 SRPBCC family protein [Prosthecochloris ethylica]RNA64806.1 cyclase [Prosthecochloris sp. ZM_2]